jgi:hypothetical protein
MHLQFDYLVAQSFRHDRMVGRIRFSIIATSAPNISTSWSSSVLISARTIPLHQEFQPALCSADMVALAGGGGGVYVLRTSLVLLSSLLSEGI